MPTPDLTTYDAFFQAATGNPAPFAYQRRLATGDGPGAACTSRLIDVPTGCGKTAAVVLAWLWNRVLHPDETHRATWPRRLVYCLPMRTLVEQTRDAVAGWMDAGHLNCAAHVDLHVLMGGEKAGDWDAQPERDAILIGTQDMLLSRALNRGYGMSRYRWPMAFGLLNNDCLWVFDETQLMGVGVETGAQIEGFRTRLGTTQTPCASWWMSATLDPARLVTVDHPEPAGGWHRVTLGAEDQNGPVRERWEARKTLAPVGDLRLAGTGSAETIRYSRDLAKFVGGKHDAGTLTLVVVNRVVRAQAVYDILARNPPRGAKVALIHSRFRPSDRQGHEAILLDRKDKNPPGWTRNRIVIATQAVEAGVDVSARTLITELAPWSSLVQRFGRCNRYGEFNHLEGGAGVFWVDLAPKDDKDAAPYLAAELATARQLLRDGRTLVGPRELVAAPRAPEPPVIRPVLRRKDLLDLFDTTADLCGNDLDIGRYVRDGEDTDAQVFWRADLPAEGPAKDTPSPVRAELCRVSVAALADFVKKSKTARAFVWNALDGRWERLARVRPGLVVLLDAKGGGYSPTLGWVGPASVLPVSTPHAPDADAPVEPRYDGDFLSFRPGPWVTLAGHTGHVVEQLDALLSGSGLDAFAAAHAAALRTAAVWHDVGKAHGEFQAMLAANVPAELAATLLAKSADGSGRNPRRGFRHELASALAWLQAGPPDAPDRDLVAYVIAAHHGKVRLSIRSLPDEKGPRDGSDRPFARGVWHGDKLPSVPLDGLTLEPLELDLGYMQMGEDEQRGPSWLARTLALRDDPALGPFRLAFLETLLRVADWRASAAEKEVPQP